MTITLSSNVVADWVDFSRPRGRCSILQPTAEEAKKRTGWGRERGRRERERERERADQTRLRTAVLPPPPLFFKLHFWGLEREEKWCPWPWPASRHWFSPFVKSVAKRRGRGLFIIARWRFGGRWRFSPWHQWRFWARARFGTHFYIVESKLKPSSYIAAYFQLHFLYVEMSWTSSGRARTSSFHLHQLQNRHRPQNLWWTDLSCIPNLRRLSIWHPSSFLTLYMQHLSMHADPMVGWFSSLAVSLFLTDRYQRRQNPRPTLFALPIHPADCGVSIPRPLTPPAVFRYVFWPLCCLPHASMPCFPNAHT